MLEMRLMVEATVECAVCGQKGVGLYASRRALIAHFRGLGWRIIRHRKGKDIEVICPDCVKKLATENAATKRNKQLASAQSQYDAAKAKCEALKAQGAE